jgi:hypothetical protein
MRQMIFAAALLVAGCGRNPDLACDIVQKAGTVTAHGCFEIDNLDASQIAVGDKACRDQGGVVVDACATDGEVGVCSTTQGGLIEDLHFYSEGGVTAASGESVCKQIKGTWTAS